MRTWYLSLTTVMLLSTAVMAQPLQQINKFAFGSCAFGWQEQTIWTDIAARQPDVFLMIGDNVYADVRQIDGQVSRAPVTKASEFTQAYQLLAEQPKFQAFKAQTPIYATWDDHDYGKNDGGKEHLMKDAAKAAHLKFFEVPADDPRYHRAGLYYSKLHQGKAGTVQFIFLDTRYFRDELDKQRTLSRPRGRYIATTDTSRTMLGETQWQWLATQLRQPADVRFIITSIQLVAEQHGWESWGTMPHEKQRMYDLIRQTEAKGVVFLSGDRHLYETAKDTGQGQYKVPYPMWDITASGLTQAPSAVDEENDFRVGKVIRDTHYVEIELQWAEDIAASQIVINALYANNQPIEQIIIPLAQLQ